MIAVATLEKFLNAAREVAKLRWPVPKPAPGLPVQRPIGNRRGVDILWPASGATVYSLDDVELNGSSVPFSAVTPFITSSLEGEIQACIALARNMDWQSEHIRMAECQSLEILEHEATAVALAGLGDPAFVPECLMPLTPLAIKVLALHHEVPVSRVNELVNCVLRREIYPASASVKAEITAVDIEVRFWQNFRFGWVALRCSTLYREQTNIHLVYISESGKEIGLDASLGAVVRHLADVAHTPDEAVSLLNRLNFLIAFFGRGNE